MGYHVIEDDKRNSNNVMVYSDGLASYSIFIEKLEKGIILPEGGTQVGATIAYSHQKIVKDNRYNVTVVGEIPAVTSMKIAESVKLLMN